MVQIAAEAARANGRGGERRREILAAAARVFRRRGLHDSGMREIAAELGMAVGNLYYYFADKEELLAFVQEEALASLLALAERVRALELPPAGRLYLLLLGHVLHLNDPERGTPGSLAHLEVELLGEARRRPILARRDRYERALRGLIEEGVASGVFRPVDPKLAALALLGAVNSTVRWFRPDGGRTAHEVGRETAELLVRGLLAGGELEPPPADLLEERAG